MHKFNYFTATGEYVAPDCESLRVVLNGVLASSTENSIDEWVEDEEGLEC